MQEAWNCMSTSSSWGPWELPENKRWITILSSTQKAWSQYANPSIFRFWQVVAHEPSQKNCNFENFSGFQLARKSITLRYLLCYGVNTPIEVYTSGRQRYWLFFIQQTKKNIHFQKKAGKPGGFFPGNTRKHERQSKKQTKTFCLG